MLTREEIISSFKKVDFPDKIIESNANDVKNIIFYTESTEPISKKEKDTKALNQSYVLPWRLLQKSYSEQINKNFNRGSNFIPKEELIDIKIDNLKFLYDKYKIPLEFGLFYFKNNYGGMNGPFNLIQIQNLYKIKKLDSTFEFRPIDIFGFKESDIFTFKSIKIINENNWIDSIIDSPLLKYNQLIDKKDESEPAIDIKEENKEKKSKIKSENKKKDIKEEKEEQKEEEKKEDKKEEKKKEKNEDKKEKNIEENKEEIKEIVKEKKDDSNNKIKEEKWELIQPKKSKSGKEKEGEDENNDIIGLKPKNTKEGKKGKKKKRQFEDVDIELGFKIK